MNTSGYVMQGLANPDGHIFMPFLGTRTSVGSGVSAVVAPASTTTNFYIPLNSLLFRYGMQDDSQELFGRGNGTSGANAQALLPGVVDQPIFSRNSRPPIASAKVFGNGGNATNIPKGIMIKALYFVYQPIGANLSGGSLYFNKNQFVSPFGAIIGTAITSGNYDGTANGTPSVATYLIPTASQAMLTTRFTEYEITVVVATGTGTCNMFGVFLDVSYNFN